MTRINKIISITMAFVLIAAAAIFVSGNDAALTLAASDTDKSSITVTGKGAIKVEPDMAYITLGVNTENKDSKTAQSQNAEKMDAVVKALKAAGIAEKDIQTSNYSMYPVNKYDSQGNASSVDRYVVQNTVKVTVRDITKVGSLIDTAVEKGANVTNSIQFTISNPDQIYQQALVAAVKDAKDKGTAIAGALGVKISTPKSVTEQGNYYIPYSYANAEESSADSVKTVTPIQTGELEITASVLVEYQY